MSDVLGVVGALVAIALVMVGLAWAARSARRRGVAGSAIAGAMAAYDEAFHSTAHDTYVEVQAQADRKVPVHASDGE